MGSKTCIPYRTRNHGADRRNPVPAWKLAEQIGLENALKSWSGQELTHKDFSYGDSWYEVKTIHRGIPAVKISSIEQLESSTDGELVVFFLEKMSAAYNGVNLNKLILETRSLFSIG